MEIKLYSNDNTSVKAGNNDRVWCSLSSVDNGYGIKLESLPNCTYVEVRKKENRIATFLFASKREKNQLSLGWWEDAEVVYAVNEVIHD